MGRRASPAEDDAHFGPSVDSSVKAHGKNGSYRRQPDITDVALRNLGEDRRLRTTLDFRQSARSCAQIVFLGRTRGPSSTEHWR